MLRLEYSQDLAQDGDKSPPPSLPFHKGPADAGSPHEPRTTSRALWAGAPWQGHHRAACFALKRPPALLPRNALAKGWVQFCNPVLNTSVLIPAPKRQRCDCYRKVPNNLQGVASQCWVSPAIAVLRLHRARPRHLAAPWGRARPVPWRTVELPWPRPLGQLSFAFKWAWE